MQWERPFLAAAVAYNAVWVAALLAFPDRIFERPVPFPAGFAAAVAAVGACYAANLRRRRPALLAVALASKAVGPILFVYASAQGYVAPTSWWASVANDLVWIPPTAALLFRESTW